MHIAIITSGYYGASGVFTHARDLSCQLIKKGIDVTVLSRDVKDYIEDEHLRFIHIRDIPLVPQVIFYFWNLISLHYQHKLNIVYGLDSIAYIAAVVFGKLRKVPLIFNFQASIFSAKRELDYSLIETRIFRFANRLAARTSDRIIGVSQEMVRCAQYAGAKEENIVLIPNLVDLDSFRKIAEVRNKRINKEFICLYVGALRPVKGVEYLIKAIPSIQKVFNKTKFFIVGDGPNRNKLEKMTQELRLSNYVEFVGNISWEKVLNYYEMADIFILPSLSDPKPLVIPEAMAAGLAVIGTKVDGIPEFVQEGYNGLLVSPANSEMLARAIIRLLCDTSLRDIFSRNSLQTAKTFSWSENIRKFEELFKETVHRVII